ncbi:bifunctional metallophosphatase/5'-nucleotidase [Arachnia rubra]|jgi:hypothetical protein|uniref:5'-nucleotidase C-terminal domain-containing protein n=1 Tax=Arachnia rubra TaxID=1547448 RepID=A0ABX7Y855_9ACTN|nr:5'-nucleotidase C-terminal domain-containing protein [Arachnia rubra]MBB1569988.1 5'-nucleotidase C-terminal domain-containing protein [Propionibacterium sp.]QUC09404.1 5'-nucleotidase C-terminal domain-containing protein [Arachnia rubra]
MALCLGLGTLFITPSHAAADPASCTPSHNVSLFTYNDFHGRLRNASALFTPVERARSVQGEANVALISSGDDIGGSTFESMADNDNPTLKVMSAVGLNVQTVGNHEFDKGWADLAGRVNTSLNGIEQLGANVYAKGTRQVASPLKAYRTFKVGDLNVAVIGAVTGDLSSVVSPAGITGLTIGDPVEAVNETVAQLPPETDLVIASIHEGAPDGNSTGDEQAEASPNFHKMWTGIDSRVHVVLNGHTHQRYSWTNAKGQLFTQAGSYGTVINELRAGVTSAGTLCGVSNTAIEIDPGVADDSLPRIQRISGIVSAAVARADEIGTTVIGKATAAISTPTGNSDVRDVESPMSNLVAQMFHEVLGNGDPYFIGVQNPGGTRDSFDSGDITYKEAALTLPFANTLLTTRLTGTQFKTVLEQQWQRNARGEIPSRPFLRLGLSSNVSYTYDESRPEGDRITSIFIGGVPLDPDRLYSLGSTSFLIAGGDNFRELAKGANTRDTGRVDLEAWTSWVKDKQTLSPSYAKRGLSLIAAPTELNRNGETVTFSFDLPSGAVKAREGVDFLLGTATGNSPKDPARVTPALANDSVEVFLGETRVGGGTVTEGRARVDISLPAGCAIPSGAQTLVFRFSPSGTVARQQVKVAGDDSVCGSASPMGGSRLPRPGLPRTGI